MIAKNKIKNHNSKKSVNKHRRKHQESKDFEKFKDKTPTEQKRVSDELIKSYSEKIKLVKKEISKVIVGQEEIIESLIRAMLCNGHVLLEGVPGIAKTLMILTLGKVTGSVAKRIQFTVDLLPSDIVGITTYTPGKGIEVIKGPVFANFLIADEINRSPPKTQSALLEAMQERNVTISKETYELPSPFFVMATENPLESSGVYFLPEAQVDRFLFKIIMGYPNRDEEKKIMNNNLSLKKFDDYDLKAIITPQDMIKMQESVRSIYLSKEIEEYIVRIVEMTRSKDATEYNKYIELGCSPRASIGIFLAAKGEALLQGRNFVIPRDVKKVVPDIIRHRLMMNYLSQSEKITPDDVVKAILDKVEIP